MKSLSLLLLLSLLFWFVAWNFCHFHRNCADDNGDVMEICFYYFCFFVLGIEAEFNGLQLNEQDVR